MEQKEERNLAVFCHLGGLLFFYFVNLIIPLIIWLTQKDKSAFIDEHGKEAVNFQISLIIYGLGLMLIGFTIIGLVIAVPGWIILFIIDIISIIRAAIKASNGQKFLYPLNLRLIK
ncbi:MAG: DUF4870 domain-containing protein [Candidatus Omnitrophica bacterium]|nr:DUF4870 domain-containing protein [Candidatus Omnitrophota bacterium]